MVLLYSTVRPYLKAFAFIEDDLRNCIFSTGFAILESRDEKSIKSKAIFCAFMYLNDLMQQIEASMGKAAYPSINTNDIENYKIKLPPLALQEQLVSEVEALEERITYYENIIAKAAASKYEVLKKYL